jgi:hypothetical protein
MKQALDTVVLWTVFCALVFVLGTSEVVAENQPPVERNVPNFCALEFEAAVFDTARDLVCSQQKADLN